MFVGKNPVCEDNEEFLACGTTCPLTCKQPEPLICGLACTMGCFCKSGYVRDETKNKCVTLDKCPVGELMKSVNWNLDIVVASTLRFLKNAVLILKRICI